ncbi:MAG TPA: hypothetical protein VJB59_06560 [Bdellovibrionota bacterium]|nr:hypothetical protein [Bdellovibrionota bacterium]
MALTRAPESHSPRKRTGQGTHRDSSGIALFLVMAAISVLSILVTEFTYVAQVSQTIAFDALDQVKVHYLAKSAYKLSLLRLKAFQTVKDLVGGGKGGGGIPAVPRQVLDKIWSFPIFYPFPTNIPGMTANEKSTIEAFQNSSGLDGKFSSTISSESGKYNLNMILAPYAPKAQPSPAASAQNPPTPAASPSPAPTFNPDDARNSLGDYITQLLNQKFEADPDFANEYRDLRVEDLVDNIVGWADRSYERRNSSGNESVAFKRAPFYSMSELRMIPLISDEIYDILAPGLTVSTTPGINVNTMNEFTLRALVPDLTKEEVTEFFKYRDSEEEDNTFKKEEDFFKYLADHTGAFKGSQAVDRFKESLTKRNIRIVVDESLFKITVQAQVNQSVRLIEAWVTLGTPKKGDSQTQGDKQSAAPPGNAEDPSTRATPEMNPKKADSGLKVTFMRIL